MCEIGGKQRTREIAGATTSKSTGQIDTDGCQRFGVVLLGANRSQHTAAAAGAAESGKRRELLSCDTASGATGRAIPGRPAARGGAILDEAHTTDVKADREREKGDNGMDNERGGCYGVHADARRHLSRTVLRFGAPATKTLR